MFFFYMMFFCDPIRVNQYFLEDRVKKITTSLFLVLSETRGCKLLRSCQKIQHPGVNNKKGIIRQSHNRIDRINFRADAKRLAHKTKTK